jgi:hypothetical protein
VRLPRSTQHTCIAVNAIRLLRRRCWCALQQIKLEYRLPGGSCSVKKPPGGVDCSSVTTLKAAVRASWPKDWLVPEGAIDRVRVTYKDEAGDDITVERDEELQAAIQEGINKLCVALPGASGEATPLSVHALPMCIVWVGVEVGC